MKIVHSTKPGLGLSVLVSAVSICLAACGGGGGGGSGETPAAAEPVVFGGVVATGAPMAQAKVTVFGRAGGEVCDTTADALGQYLCTLAAGAAAPFAIVAKLGDQSLYSTAATAASATVNVTPLTTLIVARLAPSGDPSRLVEAIQADPTVVDVAKLQARVDEVKALIAPLLAALADEVDPISGKFSADGKGHDKVLDSLQVSIRPEGNSSNIEVTVKSLPATEDSAPLHLSFRSDEAKPAPLKAAIKPEDLVSDGTAPRVAGLMGRMTACYALPLAQRVAGVAEGSVIATGEAAAVAATVCKGLFVDDDPRTFKDNGVLVGSAGAYAGLFSDASTGVTFDRGILEYQRANGDMLVSFRTTTRLGGVSYQTTMVRQQGGLLKVIGNQYRYSASVRAFATDREFPFQPAFSWLGTGYNVSIANRVDPVSRLPIFKEAYATGPDGVRTVYRPLAGRSAMVIVPPTGPQRANQVQFLAAEFMNSATPGSPVQKDGNGGAFFVDPQRTGEQILAIPDQGVWKIEWVHVDDTEPNFVQSYRTISRAPTIAEVRLNRFAQLSPDFKSELLAKADIPLASGMVFGAPSEGRPNVLKFATPSGGDGWVVPEGATAPTSLGLFGRVAGSGSFNDSASVSTTDRQGTVLCQTKSAEDLHCNGSTGTGEFAEGARITNLELWTRNARQVEIQKMVNLYRLAD